MRCGICKTTDGFAEDLATDDISDGALMDSYSGSNATFHTCPQCGVVYCSRCASRHALYCFQRKDRLKDFDFEDSTRGLKKITKKKAKSAKKSSTPKSSIKKSLTENPSLEDCVTFLQGIFKRATRGSTK